MRALAGWSKLTEVTEVDSSLYAQGSILVAKDIVRACGPRPQANSIDEPGKHGLEILVFSCTAVQLQMPL
jgi:hypothetical protein